MSAALKLRQNAAKNLQLVALVIVLLIGSITLTGWLLDLPSLRSFLLDSPPMKANTSLSFILIGLALWLLRVESPRRVRATRAIAAMVFALGLATLLEHVLRWDLGIDRLLIGNVASVTTLRYPIRMAPATAISLIAIGPALWLSSRRRSPRVVQALGIIAILIAFFALAGYLYRSSALHDSFLFSSIALSTVVALICTALGLLLLYPQHGWMGLMTSHGSGGIAARRLLPAALAVPLVIGWIQLTLQERGLASAELGVALFVLATMIVFTTLIWWNACRLNDLDAVRRHAAERIGILNRTLAVLSDINQAIVRVRDIPQLFEQSCKIAVESGGFRAAWVGVIDPGTQTFRITAHEGIPDHYLALLRRAIDRESTLEDGGAFSFTALARAGAIKVFSDIQTEPSLPLERREEARHLGYHSVALTPIIVGGSPRGLLCFYVEECDFFDTAELRLLKELAGDISFAIEFSEQEVQRQQAEASLLESESRFHRVLDNLIEGAQIIGFDWRYLYVNDAAAAAAHTSKETLLNSTLLEQIPDIETTALYSVLQRCLEDRVSSHIENLFVRPDGTNNWFELSIQPVPEGVFVLSLDVTERKEAEAASRRYTRRIELLHRIDQGLLQGDSVEALVRVALKYLREALPAQRASIVLYTGSGDECVVYAVDETKPLGIAEGERMYFSLEERQWRTKTPILAVDDIRESVAGNPNYRRSVEGGMRSALHVTLVDHSEWIGVLTLMSDQLGFFTADHQQLAIEVGDQLAIALRQHRLSKAIIDKATELERSLADLQQTQEALRQSEERYRNVVEDQTEFICRYDTQLNLTFVNRAYADIYGKTPNELIGANALNLIPEDQWIGAQAFIHAITPENPVMTVEELHLLADNQQHWIQWTDRALLDANGEIVGYQAVGRDITERKHAEEALREINETLENRVMERTLEVSRAKEQVEAILNNSTDGILLLDTDLSIRRGNPAFDTLFGCEPGVARSRSLLAFIHPEDKARMTALVESVAGERAGKHIEVRCIRAGSSCFEGSFSVGYSTEMSGDEGFVCVIQDITERKRSEQALRESERKFRSLLDAAPLATVITDTTGTITLVNHQCEMLFGYASGELLGQPISMMVPQHTANPHVENQAEFKTLHTGQVSGQSADLMGRRKDGSEFPTEIELSYVETEAGLLILAFIIDITQRRERERQLRFGASLQEAVTDAVIATDMNFCIQSWNTGAERMYGWTADETVGKRIMSVLKTEFATGMAPDAVIQGFMNTGYWQGEIRQWRRDGQLIDVLSAVVLLKDETGKPFGIVTVSHDITERKRAEEELLRQRDFLQLVVDNVPNLIIVKGSDGRFQLANRHMADVFGVSPADMLGKVDTDFGSDPEQHRFSAANDREALTSGKPIFIPEDPLMGRIYETSKIPLMNRDGAFDRVLTVASDVTERKKAEEALQRAFKQEKELGELKSRFVSMASHEFRTPLATILASAETLSAYRQRMNDQQVETRIDNIREQVNHLKNIIEDVLQLARIQAGRIEFNPSIVNLDALCRSVIDEFRSHPDVPNELIYTCKQAGRKASLDQKLMRQIINNLVSNAVKYSPDNKPICIDLDYAEHELTLRVRDQGIGIPEDDLSHLFEPFHRAANVGAISGTGLGLPITKEAIELHGGVIDVESQVGLGTTVIVKIPLSASPKDPS